MTAAGDLTAAIQLVTDRAPMTETTARENS
jgi:hypothetical protein